MSDVIEAAFELGKIVIKTFREVEESKHDSPKLLRSIGGDDREEIILQRIGKYWNQNRYFDRPDGLVVVTNKRVVFLTKLRTIRTTTDYLSFPIELIETLETTRVMFISPAVRFGFQGQKYTFTLLADAASVANAIEISKRNLTA